MVFGELGVGLIPDGCQLLDLVGKGSGQVFGLAAVFTKVVEFPFGVGSGGGEFPVAGAEAAVGHVVEVDEVALDGGVFLDDGEEVEAGEGWGREAVVFHDGLGAGEGEEGGDDVDEMGGGAAEFAFILDAGGPVDDEGGADAAFVVPVFVELEGGVGGRGPTGTEAEIGGGGAGRGRAIMHVAADDLFGGGAVVGGEEDEGVVELLEGFEAVDDAGDFGVHAGDHGGVDLHFLRLEALFDGVELGPGDGAGDFAGANLFLEFGFVEVPGGDDFGSEGRKGAVDEAHFGLSLPAALADDVPAFVVAAFLGGDVGAGRVEREVGGGEAEIEEEGVGFVVGGVLVEEGDGVVGDVRGEIEVRVGFDGGEEFVVETVAFGGEEAVVVFDVIGAVELGVGDGELAGDVPLTGVVSAIVRLAEILGGVAGPGGEGVGGFVAADLLGVIAGHEAGAGGPAAGGGVHLGEAEAGFGEGVEEGGGDFGAVAAEVGEAEVVGEDEEDVGFGGRGGIGVHGGGGGDL